MLIKNDTETKLNEIDFVAMKLENLIHDLAMDACKNQSPHIVHWLMVEHAKIHRMVRRLNQVVTGG